MEVRLTTAAQYPLKNQIRFVEIMVLHVSLLDVTYCELIFFNILYVYIGCSNMHIFCAQVPFGRIDNCLSIKMSIRIDNCLFLEIY